MYAPACCSLLANKAGMVRISPSLASASSISLTSPDFMRASSVMNSPSASAVLSLTTPPSATNGPASR